MKVKEVVPEVAPPRYSVLLCPLTRFTLLLSL